MTEVRLGGFNPPIHAAGRLDGGYVVANLTNVNAALQYGAARAILAAHHPGVEGRLIGQIVAFVQTLRKEDLEKKPGVAETLDFAAALVGLGVNDLTDDPAALQAALVTLLKTQGDRAAIPFQVAQRIAGKAA